MNRLFMTLVTALCLASCAFHENKLPGPSAFDVSKTPVDYASVRRLVLQPKCMQCHAGKVKPELVTYSEVLNQVIPKDYKDSHLFKALIQNGGKMPRKGGPISEDQMKLLIAWIQAGAPLNADSGPAQPIPIQPRFSDIQSRVIDGYCINCHNPQKSKGEVDLSSYSAIMGEIDVDGDEVVAPGDPGSSALYEEIQSGDMPDHKRGTPPVPVPPGTLQAIAQWIQSGAKNN